MKAARQAFRPWLTRFDAEYSANSFTSGTLRPADCQPEDL